MKYTIIIIVSYLIGSFPSAYLMGRLIKNIDIRNFGSGNVGATNAFRVLGKKYGIITLLIDLLKGFIPVFVIKFIVSENFLTYQIVSGFCLILGHIFTVFLKFKGGKGVATSAGFLIAVSPVPMFFTILVFLITLAATRYVSLGSIIAALTYPIFTYIWNQPLQLKILSVILALIIVVKHKSNIIRIINGVENKIPEIFKNKK